MKMSANTADKDNNVSTNKNISLPISRVRLIMKSSPDVSNINQEALFLTTKATVRLSLLDSVQIA
jgi:chromatin accessibility complex protein 1